MEKSTSKYGNKILYLSLLYITFLSFISIILNLLIFHSVESTFADFVFTYHAILNGYLSPWILYFIIPLFFLTSLKGKKYITLLLVVSLLTNLYVSMNVELFWDTRLILSDETMYKMSSYKFKNSFEFYISVLFGILEFGTSFLAFWKIRGYEEKNEKTNAHILTRTFAFISFPSLYIPVVLLSVYSILKINFSAYTGNFLSIDSKSIKSVEKIYEKNGKTLRLIPMIHAGEESFYKEITDSYDTPKTLVFSEGIKDSEGILNGKAFLYEKPSQTMGLTLQTDHFTKLIIEKNMKSQVALQKNRAYSKPVYVFSDVDVKSLSPEFVDALMGKDDTGALFEVLMNNSEELGRETFSLFTKKEQELFDFRNQHLFSVFKSYTENYDNFDTYIVPWGALHMKDIEKHFIEQGYSLKTTVTRDVMTIEKVVQGIFKLMNKQNIQVKPKEGKITQN